MKKSKIAVTLALASVMACPIALVGCGDDHTHTYDTTQWVASADGTGHYNPATCGHTDKKGNFESHVYDDDNDATCNLCDYVRTLGGTDVDENVGTISGIVTAYGAGLSGVKVSAGGKDATTDSYGHFTLAGVEIADSITVTFSKDKYNDATRTVTAESWEDAVAALGTIDMTLVKAAATVSGAVKVPANGNTITLGGATVTLCDKDKTPLTGYEPVTTAKNGAFSFDDVPVPVETELYLKVTHPYCEEKFVSLTIKVGTPEVSKDAVLMSNTIEELGNKSICDFLSVFEGEATPAADYDFRNGQGDWQVNTSSYNMSAEGLLLHQAGQDIASGTAVIKLYAYQKLGFTDIEQISLRVRRFDDSSHNAELQGGGYPEMYIVLVKADGTVITPKEGPGAVTSTNANCNEIAFTFDEALNGEYVLAVGETRGNRSAIESIRYRGAEVTGTVSGTVKLNDVALAGAEVRFGALSATTGDDGTFSLEGVKLRKGDTSEIAIKYNDEIMYVPFTATNIEDGAHSFGAISFNPLPLPNITMDELNNMAAVAANNITGDRENANTEFKEWRQVGTDNGRGNEGWLLRDAGYAEMGTTELKVFMYNKLTFAESGVKTIIVRARTFTDQNTVNGQTVNPQMILKLIDSKGNTVKINNNLTLVDTNSDDAYFYFTLDEAISGDYVFAIGMARGQRLCIGGIEYLGADEVVEKTITGTIKDEETAVSNATVSYSLGYNVKGTATTDDDGTFSINVLMRDSVTLHIVAGDKSKRYTVKAEDITGTVHNAGDIRLSVTYLTGLTSDDVEDAEVRTGTTFTHQQNAGDIKQYWTAYGDVDWGHGEGACIQLGANNPVSYMYAKFTIGEADSYMKLSARRFVRNEDQTAALKVSVIVDGVLTTIAPAKALRDGADAAGNIIGNLLKNDLDAYIDGYYDLSDYVGKTIVIVIQSVCIDNDGTEIAFATSNGKNVHNAIQEISFDDYSEVVNPSEPPAEGGDPDAGSDD